jgi:hypothetical protein
MADSRMRIWFALFVLAVFCVGAAAGIIVGRRIDRFDRPGRFEAIRGGPRGGPGGGPPQLLLERLTRELDLDAAQQEQIRAVLRDSRGRVEELQRDVRTRFDAEQKTLHDEIRKILTPEQQPRFERIVEQGRRGRGAGRRGQER